MRAGDDPRADKSTHGGDAQPSTTRPAPGSPEREPAAQPDAKPPSSPAKT